MIDNYDEIPAVGEEYKEPQITVVEARRGTLRRGVPRSVLPAPATHLELFLKRLCDGTGDVPVPTTRLETYLAYLCGEDLTLPGPYTRLELYLRYLLSHPYAPLPDGYTRLEYVRSTGTQYVDLGRKATELTRLNIRHRYYMSSSGTTSGRIIGARYTDGHRDSVVIGSRNGTATASTTSFASFGSDNIYGPNLTIGTWRDYEFDKTGFRVDGIEYATPYEGASFTTPYNLILYGIVQSAHGAEPVYGLGIGDISALEWWENGNKVIDYIPALRESDGEVGFFDAVSRTFHYSNTAESLIEGPVISPGYISLSWDPTWTLPVPVNRIERYVRYLCDLGATLPDAPVTTIERYLAYLAEAAV